MVHDAHGTWGWEARKYGSRDKYSAHARYSIRRPPFGILSVFMC